MKSSHRRAHPQDRCGTRLRATRCLFLLFAVLLLLPLSAMAQGVRMSQDFFPLDVGKRWTYEITNETGQKVGELTFAVEEYTIVSGVSFYVLSEFPFSPETGEPIRYVRYDKTERAFMRKLRNDEGPLFLDDGATTEVLESDASGTPQKFVLRRDKVALTFQRGVGIVEARMESSGRPVIAKLAAAAARPAARPVAPSTPSAPAPTSSPVTRTPTTPAGGAPVILPPPPPIEPVRREPPVASVTAENPKTDVKVTRSDAGYTIRMTVENLSDKLLPFRFSSSQTYDFWVQSSATGKEVWRWSNGNFFTQVMRSDSIRGGGKWEFDAVWDGKDNEGSPVPAGEYRVFGLIKAIPSLQASPVLVDVR